MITKVILKETNGNLYEIPHNILKYSRFASSKATSLEITMVSRDIYIKNGYQIMLYIDENLHFLGTIFNFSRNYDTVSITAYDNLMYFKSKDTFILKNITATQCVKEICSKIGVEYGEIYSTGYVLPYNFFENTPYFDIIESILSDTKQVSGENFVLYDDLGKICLTRKDENNKVYVVTDEILLENYFESSSNDIFNSVLVYQTDIWGNITKYYAKNDASISLLGQIQKTLNVDRNLTSAQCNLIAKNLLLEGENTTFTMQIDIIALEILNIYDILIINDVKYRIIELFLGINANNNIYTLTLEREV